MIIPEWLDNYVVSGQKFFVLVWKNWTIGLAHPQAVLTNIFLPILCSILLLTQRLAHNVQIENPRSYDSFSTNLSQVQQLLQKAIDVGGRFNETMPIWEVAFSPKNKFLEQLIHRTCASLSKVNDSYEIRVNYSVHENGAMLEQYLKANPRVFVGVAFLDDFEQLKPHSEIKLRYDLRFPYNMRSVPLDDITQYILNWMTYYEYYDINSNEPRSPNSSIGSNDSASYVAEGFTLMQNEIALNFIEMKANLTTPIQRPKFQRIPHGYYVIDEFMNIGDFYISFWIVISGFWAFSDNILNICLEKENQIKEVLKIAGLTNVMQWLAWFLLAVIKALITRAFILLIFITRLGNFPAILTHCYPMIYFLLQMVYTINLITLAFLISVVFKDHNSAVFFGRAAYFILALPYFVAREWYTFLPEWCLMLMALSGHSGYGLGVHVIYYNEKKGVATTFSNIFESPLRAPNYSLGLNMVMMMVGAVIHVIVLLYIEKIRPGKWGIPLKWYFLFTKSFWVKNKAVNPIDTFELTQTSNIDFFQQPTRSDQKKTVMVYCDFLTKKFGHKTAIDHVSLKLYKGELVVILGFNDSGKTVLLSMLAGILNPTSGTIVINGYDMINNPTVARQGISFVSSENIIFENLTIRQNIQFYCQLRGIPPYRTKEEIKKYLTMLDLIEYENLLALKLNEVQQRKLTIVAALCGNTKVVFIDAPCVGADPRERKRIWQMLCSEKSGRTIIVGTQYIDEGERLADRVAILRGGKLFAFGTPIFIKELFGKSHLVILTKGRNFKLYEFMNFIKSYISIDENTIDFNESEITIPIKPDQTALLSKMLEELEHLTSLMNIRSISIKSATTQSSYILIESTRLGHTPLKGNYDFKPASNKNTLRFQCTAMLYKKLLIYKYNIYNIACQYIIILFSDLLLALTSNLPVRKPSSLHLIINPDKYKDAYITIESPGNLKMNLLYKEYLMHHYPEVNVVDVPETTTTDLFMKSRYQYGTASKYYSSYIAGITYENNSTTIWFNNYFFHSIAISQNIALDVIARQYLGDEYTIDVFNNPVPKDLPPLRMIEMHSKMFNAYLITWFSLILGIFIISPVKERVSGFADQQFCHGVRPWVYWLSHFFLDYAIFLTVVFLYAGMAWALGINGLNNFYFILRITIVLSMFGAASLSLLYLISKGVDNPTSGMGTMYLLYLSFGFMISIFLFNIIQATSGESYNMLMALHYMFLTIPSYGLYSSLEKIHNLTGYTKMCTEYCIRNKDLDNDICDDIFLGHNKICNENHVPCCYSSSYWVPDGILPELLFFLAVSIFSLVTVIIVDSKIFTKNIDPMDVSVHEIDADILDEKIKAASLSRKKLFQTSVVMRDITKVFDGEIAVQNLTMRVEDGESFGFLGLLGSGKSTLLKILGGEIVPNRGGAYIFGQSLIKKKEECRKRIGYCPMDGGFYDDFKAFEYIKVFLMIHGYKCSDINKLLLEFASSFIYTPHLKTKLKDCSKYTKTKINLNVALLGNPRILLIDEPTRGMDPFKSSVIWKIIEDIKQTGKTVILSTFSVDEASYLCDRFGIMNNGEMVSVGGKVDILKRFGEGWVLQMRINEKAVISNSVKSRTSTKFYDRLDEFVTLNFFGAVLREKIGLSVQYFVPIMPEIGIRWSRTFRIMEANKEKYGIDDYSINVISLHDIFLLKTQTQRWKKPYK